jgi:hypothetical protein
MKEGREVYEGHLVVGFPEGRKIMKKGRWRKNEGRLEGR